MITALNSPKYKLSIDDMRTIAGGKKIEVVTSTEYIPVVCPDGYPSGSECFTTIAHVTIYKMRNGLELGQRMIKSNKKKKDIILN